MKKIKKLIQEEVRLIWRLLVILLITSLYIYTIPTVHRDAGYADFHRDTRCHSAGYHTHARRFEIQVGGYAKKAALRSRSRSSVLACTPWPLVSGVACAHCVAACLHVNIEYTHFHWYKQDSPTRSRNVILVDLRDCLKVLLCNSKGSDVWNAVHVKFYAIQKVHTYGMQCMFGRGVYDKAMELSASVAIML